MLSRKVKEILVIILKNSEGELDQCEINSELYAKKFEVFLSEKT